MIDHIQKYGNFNTKAIDTLFQLEGYYDLYNMDADRVKSTTVLAKNRQNRGKEKDGKRVYDFIFVPNCGFLNSNLPLLNNCELKLSFDRVPSDVAILENDQTPTNKIDGKPIKIHDCYAITEYVSSDYYRNYFSRIDTNPIKYKFEECDVTLKNLPLNETDIRLDNIRGGNSPNFIFLGIIETDALNGDMSKSSVNFQHHNVDFINITFNGRTVNGYPLEISNGSPILPLQKFLDVTNRFMNPLSSECLSMSSFVHNWIYAHQFEAESSSEGWLGVRIKLSEALSTSHTLVIWSVYSTAITIDKFHQIEKLIL